MAVPKREILNGVLPLNDGQIINIAGNIAQNAVHHSGGPRVPGVLAGKLHRLVHRGAVRDARQKGHLIDANAQVIEHTQIHFFHLHSGKMAQIEIQKHFILKDAEAKTGGKRRVTPVHPRFF
ncbi:hypothetical protein SDC9_57126 [bioreactor metagenome]|uniref:Uncharacterized protein n=1 Tax=bioreactor metagenome TaxID=1076179 RepID=A0A644X4L6_9ZZZZ